MTTAPKPSSFSQIVYNTTAVGSSQSPMIYKLSKLATGLEFRPRLQYLLITIILPQNNLTIKALVDSGCAKTSISKKLFDKL